MRPSRSTTAGSAAPCHPRSRPPCPARECAGETMVRTGLACGGYCRRFGNIRCGGLVTGHAHDPLHPGSPVRAAHLRQDPGIHGGRRAGSRRGDRRQHGHVQHRQRAAVAPAVRPGRRAGGPLQPGPYDARLLPAVLVPELHRHQGRRPLRDAAGPDLHESRHGGRSGRPAGAGGRGVLELLRRPRRQAHRGPHVYAGGRAPRRAAARGDRHVFAMDAREPRPGLRRQHDSHQRG